MLDQRKLLMGRAGKQVYTKYINDAVLLDGTADYFSFTPTADDSVGTWTFSAAVKRGKLGTNQLLFAAGPSSGAWEKIYFDTNNKLNYGLYIGGAQHGAYTSDAIFIDPTNHGHITVNRTGTTLKVYWNGKEVAMTASVALNTTDGYIGAATQHYIGRDVTDANYLDGYISELHLITGQALGASYFGQYSDAASNVWIAKDVKIPVRPEQTANVLLLGSSADSSHDSTANTSANLFDNNTSTYWRSSGAPWWVTITPQAGAQTLTSYKIGARGTGFTADEQPVAWRLEGSNDASTWHVLDVRTGEENWTAGEIRIYSVAAPASYTQYRLTFTQIGSGDICCISEWQGQTGTTTTYGDNGCYLTFEDANLGKDFSGNGNDWTVNGSPTKTKDTPTNNYCTLNPLDPNAAVVGGGNLVLTTGTAKPTMQPESGKWSYKKDGVEQLYDADTNGKFEPDLTAGTYTFEGYVPSGGYKLLCAQSFSDPNILKSSTVADIVLRTGTGDGAILYNKGSNTYSNFPERPGTIFDGSTSQRHDQCARSAFSSGAGAMTASATKDYGVDPQIISKASWYGPNNYGTVYGATGTQTFILEASQTGSAWTELGRVTWTGSVANEIHTAISNDTTTKWRYARGRVLANVNTSNRYISCAELRFYGFPGQTVNLPDMENGPDWLLVKNRSASANWVVGDKVRGDGQRLYLNTTDAQDLNTSLIEALTSTGYKLGTNPITNGSGHKLVDFALKAGSKQGFEIVEYTGDGTAARAIPHTLGKVPTFILVKRTDAVSDWLIYHKDLGQTKSLLMTTAAAAVTNAWGNTAPTDTDFYVSGGTGNTNLNAATYVAYVFTDSSIFKTFSYTGNGNANGPYIDLDGRILSIPFLKNTENGAINWANADSARNHLNPVISVLSPNTADAEINTSGGLYAFTSRGVKINTSSVLVNPDGQTSVGFAILESKKYSNAY